MPYPCERSACRWVYRSTDEAVSNQLLIARSPTPPPPRRGRQPKTWSLGGMPEPANATTEKILGWRRVRRLRWRCGPDHPGLVAEHDLQAVQLPRDPATRGPDDPVNCHYPERLEGHNLEMMAT